MRKSYPIKAGITLASLMAISLTAKSQNSGTAYSTLSGKVWKDDVADGVRGTNEQAVPGILITMQDALTDKVIATTVSDTSGNFVLNNYAGVGDYYIKYGYPQAGFSLVAKRVGANNQLNSAADPTTGTTDAFTISSNAALDTFGVGLAPLANKLTYCDVKALTVTDWNTSFSFPKSNDAVVGVLTKVSLFIADAVWHPSIGVENTGAQGISSTLGFSGLLTLTPPTGGANEVTTTLLNKQVALPAYDGITDYGGTSGITWHNEFSSIVNQNRTFTTNAQLNIFRGATGTVTFPVTAQNSFTITGGGNLENSVQTHVGAGACVVYEYAGGITLPVSLTRFTARPNGSTVALNWETAMELGNKGFSIERSADGIHFEAIGFVASLAADEHGVSYRKLDYTFDDNNPFSGASYYRLKQTDINGKETVSGIQKVTIATTDNITAFPNPADDYMVITLADGAKVSLFALNGTEIQLLSTQQGDGSVKIQTANVPAGYYQLVITLPGGDKTSRKISILH